MTSLLLLVSSSDSYTVGGLLSASTSSLSIELEGREGGERERGREEGREEGRRRGREREGKRMEKKREARRGESREGGRKGKKRERVREGECTRSCRLSQVETVCGEEPFEQKINL